MRNLRSFASFSFVGGIGFLVDASILYFALGYLGPFYGRGVSISCSIFTTWALNRNLTFANQISDRSTLKELSFYTVIMFVGAGINFATFVLLMQSAEIVQSYPIIGVAIGSCIALAWNFTATTMALYR